MAIRVAFLAGGDPLTNILSLDLDLEFGEHAEHPNQGALIRIFFLGTDDESLFDDVQLDACLAKTADGPLKIPDRPGDPRDLEGATVPTTPASTTPTVAL